jgi:hypothetical protein
MENIMKKLSFKQNCIEILSKANIRSTFLSIKNYNTNSGEISDYQICFNFNYERAIRKSIDILHNLSITDDEISKENFHREDLDLAKEEILDSLVKSFSRILLQGNNFYNKKGYQSVYYNGKRVPGLVEYKDSLYITGLFMKKKIISEAKTVTKNSNPKTMAKQFINKKLPVGKLVRFKIDPNRFREINVANLNIKGKL